VTTANNAGIWADDSNGTRHLVTRTSGTAPGAGSAILSKLSDPVYNNAEEVAFRGQLATTGTVTAKNEYGIWSNIGGTLALVRRQGGQADGCGAGVLYNSFNAIVLSDDALVFVATLTGANTAAGVRSTNNIGIWAVSILDGQTRLIARTGFADPSTNKMIKTLTIFPVVPIVTGQSRSVDAIAGNIIYQATFTDGTTALLKAVVE
jgi:hypothetical protein